MTANDQRIDDGIVKVTPKWKKEVDKTKSIVFVGSSIALGAVLGPVVISLADAEDDVGINPILAGTMAGALWSGMLGVNNAQNAQRSKARDIQSDEYDKWLKKFNKGRSNKYFVLEKSGRDLTLMSSTTKSLIEEYERSLISTTNRINTSEVSWDQLNADRQLLTNKYNTYHSDKVNALKTAIINEEGDAAFLKLKELQLVENQKSATRSTLIEIESFESKNRELWNKISDDQRKDIQDGFSDKILKILTIVLNEEKITIDKLGYDLNKIDEVNSYFFKLRNLYNKYDYTSQVKELYQYFKKYKTQLITRNYSLVSTKIKDEISVRELNIISDKYLANTLDSREMNSLESYIQGKIRIIENYYKEKEAERRRLAAARTQLIESNRKFVNETRNKLEREYGSDFPSFEDLHYVLQAYLNLINPSGKYYESDAEQFIRLVEQKGFRRKKSGNISGDDETFENGIGYKIKSSALSSVDGEALSYTKFTIPNFTREMREMYSKELVTEYRNRIDTEVSPSYIPGSNDFYLNSGRTIYNMSIEGKELIISARRNSDAFWAVMTERIDENTLNVTSFSNMTDIYLEKGQIISFNASGSIRVGLLTTPPSGIDGWRSYNVVPAFRHGILMGKIGKDGEWFAIGSQNTIKADRSGRLYLRMNEKDVSNNEGSFRVSYTIN